jgi:hypothetical protein
MQRDRYRNPGMRINERYRYRYRDVAIEINDTGDGLHA